jgi:hypothetical protein
MNLLNPFHYADASVCSTFCWHVKYKCHPTQSLSETTAKRPAFPTQHSENTHTITCQTHFISHHEYAHRLPATKMRHYTHTNATKHPVTPTNYFQTTVPDGLPKRGYDWWAGSWDGTSATQRENTQLRARQPTPTYVSIAICRHPANDNVIDLRYVY